MRTARPQDVLVGATFDEQADSLAAWIVDTLTAVEDAARRPVSIGEEAHKTV